MDIVLVTTIQIDHYVVDDKVQNGTFDVNTGTFGVGDVTSTNSDMRLVISRSAYK